ncbi:MAG: DUF192 domain-containing protein [Burkholderiales bacterium]|nr:MAG: DUF192 domain-containing protein [Burkholderiales bacterium]
MMTARRFLLHQLLLASVLAMAFAGPRAASAQLARPGPAPAPERIRLTAAIHVISAEVVATPAARARGLMYRRSLGTNEGMLFVFEASERHCFWMRNTLIPLSIAFLADDGRIVNIADMAPQTDDSHCPAEPVRFALEMNQRWFARRGIGPGARVSGAPFASAPKSAR